MLDKSSNKGHVSGDHCWVIILYVMLILIVVFENMLDNTMGTFQEHAGNTKKNNLNIKN
jgi:hypothetical protein